MKKRRPLSRAEQDSLPSKERDMFSFVADFNQRTYEAAQGILCRQDAAVPPRDGTAIYADIFLKDSGPVPVIGSWSPFGKRPGDGLDEWQLMGAHHREGDAVFMGAQEGKGGYPGALRNRFVR